MGVIKEVIYEINFWSPPLKKHRYTMTSIAKKKYVSSGEGSGLLFEEIHKREKFVEESGLLKKSSVPDDYNEHVEGTDEEGVLLEANASPSGKAPAKRKFRTLKKLEDILYDDTLVKMGEREDEAYEVLNADGYYDEILPIDADVEYEPEDVKPVKAIAIASILLFGLLVLGIWYVSKLF